MKRRINRNTSSPRANLAKRASLLLLALGAVSMAEAQPQIDIELPNEHEFIRLQDVEIKEQDGRTAINGSAVRTRNKFVPWGSHLHIDLIEVVANDEGEENDTLLRREIYRFRRSDFDDGGRFERFFTYVDLSDPSIDKIVMDTFTQRHTETCGEEEEETTE